MSTLTVPKWNVGASTNTLCEKFCEGQKTIKKKGKKKSCVENTSLKSKMSKKLKNNSLKNGFGICKKQLLLKSTDSQALVKNKKYILKQQNMNPKKSLGSTSCESQNQSELTPKQKKRLKKKLRIKKKRLLKRSQSNLVDLNASSNMSKRKKRKTVSSILEKSSADVEEKKTIEITSAQDQKSKRKRCKKLTNGMPKNKVVEKFKNSLLKSPSRGEDNHSNNKTRVKKKKMFLPQLNLAQEETFSDQSKASRDQNDSTLKQAKQMMKKVRVRRKRNLKQNQSDNTIDSNDSNNKLKNRKRKSSFEKANGSEKRRKMSNGTSCETGRKTIKDNVSSSVQNLLNHTVEKIAKLENGRDEKKVKGDGKGFRKLRELFEKEKRKKPKNRSKAISQDGGLQSSQQGSQNLKLKEKMKKKKKDEGEKTKDLTSLQEIIPDAQEEKLNSSLTLRKEMLQTLKSSRFRFINEQLYTTSSQEAEELFKGNPDLFHKYHEGFKQQVDRWPLNPVDRIITTIKRRPANLVVADFGCGDAKIAKSVPNKVHSFDLVALSEEVTACNMADTPLQNGSVDICVFCLSLMGTNLESYLAEANRVMKVGATLKIAEVASRFDNLEGFIDVVKRFGFTFLNKDVSHDLFYFLNFNKASNIRDPKGLPKISLKPCWYKKR